MNKIINVSHLSKKYHTPSKEVLALKDISFSVSEGEIDAWPKDINFKEESFNHLQEIMIEYGELDEMVPYKDLFYNN